MTANNITRMLQAKRIGFSSFDLPAEKLGAEESARLLGVPTNQVFKTIVVRREKPGKFILAVIPGDHEVDLKLLAAAAGEKKVILPTQREAEQVTGLLAGGISPLALLNRGFHVWLDEESKKYPEIHISGGQRGLNIRLAVADLITLTNARVAKISRQQPAT